MLYQVLDNIYKIELPIPFPLKTMNVYFIDEAPRTLVDAGIKTEASLDTLKKGLETIGYCLDSIERILITHGHIDHYGQAKRLSSLSDAPIYIHSKEYGKRNRLPQGERRKRLLFAGDLKVTTISLLIDLNPLG
jgi:glyoxylase-like metal-dependent hydrolase (beta-lactamase superfamily II)